MYIGSYTMNTKTLASLRDPELTNPQPEHEHIFINQAEASYANKQSLMRKHNQRASEVG